MILAHDTRTSLHHRVRVRGEYLLGPNGRRPLADIRTSLMRSRHVRVPFKVRVAKVRDLHVDGPTSARLQ